MIDQKICENIHIDHTLPEARGAAKTIHKEGTRHEGAKDAFSFR